MGQPGGPEGETTKKFKLAPTTPFPVLLCLLPQLLSFRPQLTLPHTGSFFWHDLEQNLSILSSSKREYKSISGESHTALTHHGLFVLLLTYYKTCNFILKASYNILLAFFSPVVYFLYISQKLLHRKVKILFISHTFFDPSN